jgi:hypothetical protein
VHARRREGLAAKRHANFVQKWGVSVWRVRSKSGSKYEASDWRRDLPGVNCVTIT